MKFLLSYLLYAQFDVLSIGEKGKMETNYGKG
nr:MAG TPA: hypothetical protein [Caudoviricetes sp.]